MGGILGLPFQSSYCSSKFALEGLSESMRMELQRFGVNVVLIDPGDFNTNITQNRLYLDSCMTDSPYRAEFDKAMSIMRRSENRGPSPEIIARLVGRIMSKSSPRVRYHPGPMSQRIIPLLKKWLPARVSEKLIMMNYGL